jgi:hypothetical protein
MLFIDLNADGNYQRPEPLVQLPTDIALPAASPWNNNQLEQVMAPGAPLGTELLIISASRATAPTFNARGRACQPGNLPNGITPDGITVCNTEVGGGGGAQRVAYGIYLQLPTLGDQGWAAVTVSPGGRIKRWSRDVAAGTWR